jgi:hypothetical protein
METSDTRDVWVYVVLNVPTDRSSPEDNDDDDAAFDPRGCRRRRRC